MAIKSGALAVGVGFSQVATAAVGEEAVAFGLVFSNTMNAERTVTLRLFVQAEGAAVDIQFTLAAKTRGAWEKAVGLQPGDVLSVAADAAGVQLLFSVDVDDGSNPVASALVPRGPYSALADYSVNHFVEADGSAYVSLVDGNVGNDPAASPASWMLFAEVPQSMVDASVASAVAGLVDGAPGALDTLNELAAALGDDPNFATTMAAALAARALTATTITGGGLVTGGGSLAANRVLSVTAASLAQIRAGKAAGVVVTPEGQDDALAPVIVADAATVAWDLEAAPDGVVTMTASRTIGAPTNAKLGKVYSLRIESTGAFTPAFNGCFDFGSNGAGTFPSGAGKYGVLDAECLSLAPLKFRSNLWKGS